MKILVITQKIEKQDDVFGFFHNWLLELALKVEKAHIICLQMGEHSLPSNAQVWSLGKERRESRLLYVFKFYKYIWKLRDEYDIVFIHMNSIYVVLGSIFWKIFQKKIFFWYNHKKKSLKSRAAIMFSDVVFYTSPFSFASKFKKAKKMPAGIDTSLFKKDASVEKIKNSILCLGRISKVKNIHILIEAVKLLDRDSRDFVLNIVGSPGIEDRKYFKKIKSLSKELEEKGRIKFWGGISNMETPKIYNQHELCINLTNSGSFDKTILEAGACETMVVLSNQSFLGVLPDFLICRENNIKDLKEKIINFFAMPDKQKQELAKTFRSYVLQNHSLDNLINKLINEFKA